MSARLKSLVMSMAIVLCSFSAAAYAASWKVTDLGSVSTEAFIYLNNAGQVAGADSPNPQGGSPFTAFVTGADGVNRRNVYTNTSLESLSYGINDAGIVLTTLGSGNDWTQQTSDANSTNPTFYNVAKSVYYYGTGAINSAGKVVGMGSPIGTEPGYSTFIANQDGSGFTPLTQGQQPSDINSSGQILFRGNGVDDGMGPTGIDGMAIQKPEGVLHMWVTRMNDTGQVVGDMGFSDGWPHAFVTGPNGVGVTDLGTMGSLMASALAINNAGQVVGSYGDNFSFSHAFITEPGGKNPRDLTNEVTLPVGTLTRAAAINEKGQVVALDEYNHRAYLLTPESGCTVSYKVTGSTFFSFAATITVRNLASTAAKGWTVNWTYNPLAIVVDVKNAMITQKHFTTFRALPIGTNATIAANSSTSFTFLGTKGSSLPVMKDLTATVGGQTCTVSVQ